MTHSHSDLKWKAINKYCIRSGPYRIAKTLHGDKSQYTLSRGEEILGIYDDADKAREHAVRDKR